MFLKIMKSKEASEGQANSAHEGFKLAINDSPNIGFQILQIIHPHKPNKQNTRQTNKTQVTPHHHVFLAFSFHFISFLSSSQPSLSHVPIHIVLVSFGFGKKKEKKKKKERLKCIMQRKKNYLPLHDLFPAI